MNKEQKRLLVFSLVVLVALTIVLIVNLNSDRPLFSGEDSCPEGWTGEVFSGGDIFGSYHLSSQIKDLDTDDMGNVWAVGLNVIPETDLDGNIVEGGVSSQRGIILKKSSDSKNFEVIYDTGSLFDSNYDVELSGVYISDSDEIVVVGNAVNKFDSFSAGIVLYSFNGGSSWETKTLDSSTLEGLYGVGFASGGIKFNDVAATNYLSPIIVGEYKDFSGVSHSSILFLAGGQVFVELLNTDYLDDSSSLDSLTDFGIFSDSSVLNKIVLGSDGYYYASGTYSVGEMPYGFVLRGDPNSNEWIFLFAGTEVSEIVDGMSSFSDLEMNPQGDLFVVGLGKADSVGNPKEVLLKYSGGSLSLVSSFEGVVDSSLVQPRSIYSVDDSNVFVYGTKVVDNTQIGFAMNSADGGNTWDEISFGSSDTSSIFGEGVIVGVSSEEFYLGTSVQSTEVGSDLQAFILHAETCEPTEPYVDPRDMGCVEGFDLFDVVEDYSINEVYLIPGGGGKGFAVGSDQSHQAIILRTLDGGETWLRSGEFDTQFNSHFSPSLPLESYLYSLDCEDSDHCFAVGDYINSADPSQPILKGLIVEFDYTATNLLFHDFWFKDADFSGKGSLIGEKTTFSLYGVDCARSDSGGNSFCLATGNAGPFYSDSSSSPYYFITLRKYIVPSGDSDWEVISSLDAETLDSMNAPSEIQYSTGYSIKCLDEHNCFAVGSWSDGADFANTVPHGMILESNDGGISWFISENLRTSMLVNGQSDEIYSELFFLEDGPEGSVWAGGFNAPGDRDVSQDCASGGVDVNRDGRVDNHDLGLIFSFRDSSGYGMPCVEANNYCSCFNVLPDGIFDNKDTSRLLSVLSQGVSPVEGVLLAWSPPVDAQSHGTWHRVSVDTTKNVLAFTDLVFEDDNTAWLVGGSSDLYSRFGAAYSSYFCMPEDASCSRYAYKKYADFNDPREVLFKTMNQAQSWEELQIPDAFVCADLDEGETCEDRRDSSFVTLSSVASDGAEDTFFVGIAGSAWQSSYFQTNGASFGLGLKSCSGLCGDGVVDGDEECEVGVDGAVASCNPACESSCNYCSSSCTWQTATGGSCGGTLENSGGSGGGCDRCDPEEAWKCGAYTNCVGGKKECYRWELQKDCCSNTLKPQLDLDCTVVDNTHPETPTDQTEPQITEPKKKSLWWLWLILGLAILIVLALIGFLIYARSKKVEDDFSLSSPASKPFDESGSVGLSDMGSVNGDSFK